MVEPAFNQQLLKNKIDEENPTAEYTGEEQKLLMGDKKNRLSEHRKDSVTTESGVLSIP